MRCAIHLDQLRKEYARWPASEQQHAASDLQLHSLDAVHGAGGRLEQNRLEIWEIANGEHHSRGVPAVFSHAARYVATVSCDVFA